MSEDGTPAPGLSRPPSEACGAPPQSPPHTPGTEAEESSAPQGLMGTPTEKEEVLENGHSNGISTPNPSITCQPQARSTPLLPPPTPPDSPSDSTSLLQNGVSAPPTQQNGGVRNGRTREPRPPSATAPPRHPSATAPPRPPSTTAPPRPPSTTAPPRPPSQKHRRELQSNPSITSQASKRSKSSSRSGGSQIPTEAQDDCCVHCILACLFCEFLTLCTVVLDCASCGSCASDACCCCCGSEDCGDCDLPCDMDCGIIDACCESADCLEICMECCGLCFSS